MAVRDIASILAGVTPVTVSIADGATNLTSAIDLGEDSSAFVLFCSLSGALALTDVVSYNIVTADTSGGDYTAINDDSYLPSWRKVSADREVINPETGYLQAIGAIDTKRYIKLQVVGTTVDTTRTLTVFPVLKKTLSPFWGWDGTQGAGSGT